MWAIAATWPFARAGIMEAARDLSEGGDSMDAVVQAAAAVEADLEVDSVGIGGRLNWSGELEQDAAVMDGRTLDIGAIAASRHCRSAIRLARAVLTQTKHNFIAGEGADRLAALTGNWLDDPTTARSREEWARHRAEQEPMPEGHDTVGVVALCEGGGLCAGTSTSGLAMKRPGRVGDSPLVGSGFYADECGAAVATGVGEDIMRGLTCYRAVERMRQGASAQEAAEYAVKTVDGMLRARGRAVGNIAVVCLDRAGGFGGAANHEGFAYAAACAGRAGEVYPVVPISGRP